MGGKKKNQPVSVKEELLAEFDKYSKEWVQINENLWMEPDLELMLLNCGVGEDC